MPKSFEERLEAIAMNLEVVSEMQRSHEERYEREMAQIRELLHEASTFINKLAHIAQDHDTRLDNLER